MIYTCEYMETICRFIASKYVNSLVIDAKFRGECSHNQKLIIYEAATSLKKFRKVIDGLSIMKHV